MQSADSSSNGRRRPQSPDPQIALPASIVSEQGSDDDAVFTPVARQFPEDGTVTDSSQRRRGLPAALFNTYCFNSPADNAARQSIRALLQGTPVPQDMSPACLGVWAETVRLLNEAQAAEGADGVHRAFAALAHLEPALFSLLCGETGADKIEWTAAELYAADFAPPRMVVDGLLPTGLTILAGRPKLGKSWLALQIAAAVGKSGAVFGLPAKRGRVLFLALEDTPSRLSDRLRKQQIPEDVAITFFTKWEPLGQQGLSHLMLAAAKGYTLIIIDTLSRVVGRADQMDAADMTLFMSNLQRLATENDLALLLIDHHRKPGVTSSADPVDDIFGSTAKAGVVDGALGLYKQHGEREAVLKITGRDLDERELALRWDTTHFGWTRADEAQEPAHTGRQQEALDALAKLGKANLRDLVVATGQERSNLFRRLQSLEQSGVVTRVSEGGHVYYALAK